MDQPSGGRCHTRCLQVLLHWGAAWVACLATTRQCHCVPRMPNGVHCWRPSMTSGRALNPIHCMAAVLQSWSSQWHLHAIPGPKWPRSQKPHKPQQKSFCKRYVPQQQATFRSKYTFSNIEIVLGPEAKISWTSKSQLTKLMSQQS